MNQSIKFDSFMTATATAPAKAPRKRRTRKVTAVKKTPTKTVVKSSRPSSARLITADRYIKDIKARWAIHQYEVQELIKDVRTVYDATLKYVQSVSI